MLAAEAVRLLAVEALLPTAMMGGPGPFPTLAGERVFDSRAAAVTDIDAGQPYTPVLSLYTPESRSLTRAPGAAADDRQASCVLDIVAELAIVETDDNGEPYTSALADGDVSARLVLAALVAQVRAALTLAESGSAWRKLVRDVMDIEEQSFAIPEYDLRFYRIVTRYRLDIRDDRFDVVNGGLPEPIGSVYAQLPDASYAKAKLGELAAAFAGQPRTPLTEIHGTTPEGAGFGLNPDLS